METTVGLGRSGAVRVPASDDELVAAALGGDRRAFEALVRRHQRPLVNHLYRQLGQQEVARDLAQEVFLKVYLCLDRFDPAFRFKTWLYRIASNCAIDHLRKRRPATCSLHSAREDRVLGAAVLVGRDPTPDDVCRLHELQRRLEEAVRELPPELRQLILLRHRQSCRYDEIARITDLPLGTVKNRIFRAREILREKLADLLEGRSPGSAEGSA
jgi:RNA polymerase sigma-70 factor (ECF subfamily)